MEVSESIVVNSSVGNTPTKSPWGKTPNVVPCSFSAVMDEEVAKELQAKEDYLAGYHLQGSTVDSPESIFKGTIHVIILIVRVTVLCDFFGTIRLVGFLLQSLLLSIFISGKNVTVRFFS